MTYNWHLILANAWPIFWITTLYSYIACGVVGTVTGIKTKNDKVKIDEQIEKFIISPFYVATFFSLFTVCFYAYGSEVANAIGDSAFTAVGILGLTVFFGHLLVELLEATLIRRDPLRMLHDKDAIKLSGIYLLLILMISVMIVWFNNK
jgi:uncharacterized membrane protein